MLFSLSKKSLFAVYFSILRPCLAANCANLSAMASTLDGDEFSIAYVTVPDTNTGKTLAHGLVKARLAACVNLIPQITSIYRWQGEVNEDSESLLMIKTRTCRVQELTDYVKRNHPYEVCEVITLPIKGGNPDYFKWLGSSVPACNCCPGVHCPNP